MTRAPSLAETPDMADRRRTDSLAALALTLLLVVVGLYLVDVLRSQAAIQDCVLSGQSECEEGSASF